MTTTFVARILYDLTRRSSFKLLYEMRIPDKWLDYSRIGEQIGDLPFICFKTPLSERYSHKYSKYGLYEDEEFTPVQLCEEVENKGIKLGMVIDLTNTYRYYDGIAELEERFGIRYKKIKFDAYNPACFTPVFQIFTDCVKQFLERAKKNEVIGLHCTHGLNRTGYMICRYLIEEHNYSSEDAINLFNQTRGHDMEKYLSELREIWTKKSALEDRHTAGESTGGKHTARESTGCKKDSHTRIKRSRIKPDSCLRNVDSRTNDTSEISGRFKGPPAREKILAGSRERTLADSRESIPVGSRERTLAESRESIPVESRERTLAESRESIPVGSRERTLVESQVRTLAGYQKRNLAESQERTLAAPHSGTSENSGRKCFADDRIDEAKLTKFDDNDESQMLSQRTCAR